MKAVETSVRCSLNKERVPEKKALSRFSIYSHININDRIGADTDPEYRNDASLISTVKYTYNLSTYIYNTFIINHIKPYLFSFLYKNKYFAALWQIMLIKKCPDFSLIMHMEKLPRLGICQRRFAGLILLIFYYFLSAVCLIVQLWMDLNKCLRHYTLPSLHQCFFSGLKGALLTLAFVTDGDCGLTCLIVMKRCYIGLFLLCEFAAGQFHTHQGRIINSLNQ